jgi:valyl-tRNA synthetase
VSSVVNQNAEMDFKELPSQYDHAAAQKKWYPFWEQRGYFHADAEDPRPPYTIVIPPPNVTGALHLGHALNNTLQDILIRMKRMQGFNTLWMPGTDHAGIATQAVVERRLFEEEKKTRHDLGREGLVKRIWDWKDKYEARILGQLRQLGCSCDWQRTRFTLDDQCACAVREWFFRLFKDGKIYRGKRLVNWDTFLQTAVSDDEVFHEPTKGHFWHFKYPVIDPKPGEPTHVTIATTRPETMLGDTAVAVHPNPAEAFDKMSAALREKLLTASAKEKAELEEQMRLLLDRRAAVESKLVQLRDMAKRGVRLWLPLSGELDEKTGQMILETCREIPLITDEWADPMLGSGAVKITPAHDVNDYEVWRRHPEIGIINIMNPDGKLNDAVPPRFRGMLMKQGRQQVTDEMEIQFIGTDRLYDPNFDREDREIDLAHSDRSKTAIEPYVADQWFVDMHTPFFDENLKMVRKSLADIAIDAVINSQVKIVPERYSKGYLDWLGEKRDWPVGRQLWWGHRIPMWVKEFDLPEELIPAAATMRSKQIVLAHVGLSIDPGDDLNRKVRASIDSGKILDTDSLAIHRRETTIAPPAEFETGISVDFVTNRVFYSICYLGDDIEVKQKLERLDYTQYPEVLDTWFSSALWPQSTLGWPEETPELKKFYPTTALVTSRDIITLWVARMVIAGLYNVGEIPFHEVYITPKILDGYGETMSKSKGNGVDPLDVIEKFGADALRFGIAHLTTDTQDVKLPVDFECPHCRALIAQTKKNRILPRIECEKCGKEFSTQWAERPEDKALPRGAVVGERFELGRNFANKLWNAARFSLINLEGHTAPGSAGGSSDNDLLLEDRWLLSRLSTVTQQTTDALEHYRYADAARTLYDFAWNEFCSFYVEMTKARFAMSEQRETAQRVLAHALDVLMRLLHPMMPFLTEEVWQLLAQIAPERGLLEAEPSPGPSLKRRGTSESICIAPWPKADTARQDAMIEQQFADFQAVLGAVREARQRQNIPFKEDLSFSVRCNDATAKLLEPMQPYFTQMARASATQIGPAAAPIGVPISITLAGQSGTIEVHVDVSRFIDVTAECNRLEKERDTYNKQIASIESKLANKGFVDKAPAEVVQQQRDKLSELRSQLASVEAALKKLKNEF